MPEFALSDRVERETFERYGQYMFAANSAKQFDSLQTSGAVNLGSPDFTPSDLIKWLSNDTQRHHPVMFAVVKQVAAFAGQSLAINPQEILAEIRSSQTDAHSDELDFSSLFTSIEAGEHLIPSDEIRALARRVAELRHDDLTHEQWASALIADVQDARD